MKIIHCADIHLDSAFSSRLPVNLRTERKKELLISFTKMIEYADNNDVAAIIIAGDLFDSDVVSNSTKDIVLNLVKKYSDIIFFYLRGNHDDFNCFRDDVLPSNFKTFSKEWITYDLSEKVTVSGLEFSNGLNTDIKLFDSKINIVTLHGQESNSKQKKGELINISSLEYKNIDYLALGHTHSHCLNKLAPYGKWAYSGSLCARGFDELGEHGFYLLDIDENKKETKVSFVKMNGRSVIDESVDISVFDNTLEIIDKINSELDANTGDLVRLRLNGTHEVDNELDLAYIQNYFKDKYYYFELKNEVSLYVNYEKYRYDKSLKGEFIRKVEADASLSEEEKKEIIKQGISLFKGEEVK